MGTNRKPSYIYLVTLELPNSNEITETEWEFPTQAGIFEAMAAVIKKMPKAHVMSIVLLRQDYGKMARVFYRREELPSKARGA